MGKHVVPNTLKDTVAKLYVVAESNAFKKLAEENIPVIFSAMCISLSDRFDFSVEDCLKICYDIEALMEAKSDSDSWDDIRKDCTDRIGISI